MRFIMSIFMIWPFSIFLNHKIAVLKEVLLSESQPIDSRYRALQELRYIPSKQVVDIIGTAMNSTSDLLSQEAAFYLGQIGDDSVHEMLTDVLKNDTRATIVRFRAAEALGTIGKSEPSIIEALSQCQNSVSALLREGCTLALQKINYMQKHNFTSKDANETQFLLTDVTPALNSTDIDELKMIYLDNANSLFERHRALLALRNIGTDEAVDVITDGLKKVDSPSLRFHTANVLRTLAKNNTADVLLDRAKDLNEHQVVRQASIHALGCMGEYIDEIKEAFLNSTDPVISQAAEIAVNMCKNDKSYLQRVIKFPEASFDDFFFRLFK